MQRTIYPIGVNPENVDFFVVSTERPVEKSQVDVLESSIPDWALVVIFGLAISICIVAMLGCTVGCNRWRQNRLLKSQYLSAKTLADIKSFQSMDDLEFDGDSSSAPIFKKKRKENMWETQRINQKNMTLNSSTYARINLPPSSFTLPPGEKVADWQHRSSTADWSKKKQISPRHHENHQNQLSSSAESDSGVSSHLQNPAQVNRRRSARSSNKNGVVMGTSGHRHKVTAALPESCWDLPAKREPMSEPTKMDVSQEQLLEDMENQSDSDGSSSII